MKLLHVALLSSCLVCKHRTLSPFRYLYVRSWNCVCLMEKHLKGEHAAQGQSERDTLGNRISTCALVQFLQQPLHGGRVPPPGEISPCFLPFRPGCPFRHVFFPVRHETGDRSCTTYYNHLDFVIGWGLRYSAANGRLCEVPIQCYGLPILTFLARCAPAQVASLSCDLENTPSSLQQGQRTNASTRLHWSPCVSVCFRACAGARVRLRAQTPNTIFARELPLALCVLT
jgi:hypothetical protein